MATRVKNIMSVIYHMVIPKPSSSQLGRWSLKHDPKVCDNYLKNLHSDPGYPVLPTDILNSNWSASPSQPKDEKMIPK